MRRDYIGGNAQHEHGAMKIKTAGERDYTLGALANCVFVAPDELHRFRNTSPDELKFLYLIPKPPSADL